MKILVFGPPGSGKTFLTKNFKCKGINAIDAELMRGLAYWRNKKAFKKVPYPKNPDSDFFKNNSYVWNKAFLAKFLSKTKDIILFGSFGNLSEVYDLFDRSFFLKVDPVTLRNRFKKRKAKFGKTEDQVKSAISWSRKAKRIAKKLGFKFIDSTLNPDEIFLRIFCASQSE